MTQPERIRPRVRALLAREPLGVRDIAKALGASELTVRRSLAHRWFEAGDERLYRLSEQGRAK